MISNLDFQNEYTNHFTGIKAILCEDNGDVIEEIFVPKEKLEKIDYSKFVDKEGLSKYFKDLEKKDKLLFMKEVKRIYGV